ncbi:hypothetical protein [Zhongshania sp.]|jgi:hypothetical protein|uniref:hypothetical protein n=1 Tax=Zhongshania sp. TaxID=1971902 RepID=UPI001B4E233C|nr:hypothetical protein [Zhongshania sp.]MBQ0795554.1 hypothetical protein [Zhongshania sp.]
MTIYRIRGTLITAFALLLLAAPSMAKTIAVRHYVEHWAYVPLAMPVDRCKISVVNGEFACPEHDLCVRGDCINGVGTKQTRDGNLSYHGRWQQGRPVAGEYTVTYRGQQFRSIYDEQGLILEGFLRSSDAYYGDPDYFVGTFKHYQHPFTKKIIPLPDSGTYYFASGVTLQGDFIAIPTVGSAGRDDLQGSGPIEMKDAFNLFFVGTVTLGNESETGIYVQREYAVAEPLDMMPSDKPTIEKIYKEYQAEVAQYERYQERKERTKSRKEQEQARKAKNRMPWDKVFALAAGAALANSADMPADAKSEFITAYSKDVLSGSTDNLASMQSRYGDNRSVDEIFREGNRELQAIVDQKVAAYEAAQKPISAASANGSSTAMSSRAPGNSTGPNTMIPSVGQGSNSAGISGTAKPKTAAPLCSSFKLTSNRTRTTVVNGTSVKLSTDISPSIAGTYWFRNAPKGESGTRMVIKPGGKAIRYEPGREVDFSWGIALRDDGKLECPDGRLLVAVEYESGEQEHEVAYLLDGNVCVGGMFFCR